MTNLVRAVKWPIISWIVVDVVFLAASYVPGVLDMLTPTTIAPLTLAFGIWAGYKAVEFGGNYGSAIVAGIVVGVVCGVLTVVGFGGIRGLGMAAILPLGVYSLGMNVSGALVGGGYALSK